MTGRGDAIPLERLDEALAARQGQLTDPHTGALRLFNGYNEGFPGLVVEVFATSLVLFDHREAPEGADPALAELASWYRQRLPWLTAALLKTRAARDPALRNGQRLWDAPLARRIVDDGVRYALALDLHQDASFFLDTRGLRAWLRAHAHGLHVLNTFAYTGSLGAACLAGGAARVVQTDLDRRFLTLAKDTCALNGWPVQRADFLAGDFFRISAQLRRSGPAFDLAILDPPFFSATSAGRVDLVAEPAGLVNKLRPLVRDGGWLVAVNNALYTPGRAYLDALEKLCQGGYLQLEELIPVPPDVAGLLPAAKSAWPADPAPFNHPTKIAVLRVHKPV
jgi:23S rRNA (cytosine1962-C5)-methyltransferase